MTGHTLSQPLTRRLVTWYLAFGLAGLFLSLAITILLMHHDRIADFVPLAAVVPLGVLAVGAIVLSQTVRFHDQIEQQLLRISTDPTSTQTRIESLPGNEPAIVGWNTLLERLATQESLAALEKRLSGSLAGRRDHQAHRCDRNTSHPSPRKTVGVRGAAEK